MESHSRWVAGPRGAKTTCCSLASRQQVHAEPQGAKTTQLTSRVASSLLEAAGGCKMQPAEHVLAKVQDVQTTRSPHAWQAACR
eukprot:1141267-Pelagomonas_calceolata.AAC.3